MGLQQLFVMGVDPNTPESIHEAETAALCKENTTGLRVAAVSLLGTSLSFGKTSAHFETLRSLSEFDKEENNEVRFAALKALFDAAAVLGCGALDTNRTPDENFNFLLKGSKMKRTLNTDKP